MDACDRIMIKAVFFDIDGTLVSFKTHAVPESARRALTMLREKGIKVFIASGRHISSINNLPGLFFDGYVTVNGTLATLCAGDREEVVYRRSIPEPDIRNWIDHLEVEPRSTILVAERGLLMNYTDPRMEQIFDLLNFPVPPVGDLRVWQSDPVFQIITTFEADDEPRLMGYLPHCKTTRWHPLFTDIIEQGGSKALGIEALMRHLEYDRSEIMAFGDGGNDVEMLQLAGIGVAMGGASESVKSVADYVTDEVENDGIFHALRHFNII